MIHRCGRSGPRQGPTVAPLPPRRWHGPQQERDYVTTSAVSGAQTKPQREGRWVLLSFSVLLFRICLPIALCVCVCACAACTYVQRSHIPCVLCGSAMTMLFLTTGQRLFHNNLSFCKAALTLQSKLACPCEIGGARELGDTVTSSSKDVFVPSTPVSWRDLVTAHGCCGTVFTPVFCIFAFIGGRCNKCHRLESNHQCGGYVECFISYQDDGA